MSEIMKKDEKILVYKTALEIGCCCRCALRYSTFDERFVNFDNPRDFLENFWGLKYNNENGHINKKTKLNPCIVCLDVLSDEILNQLIELDELKTIEEYDCPDFTNYVSFPTSILVRERSINIYLTENFGKFFEGRIVTPMNRAWSLSVQKRLAKVLKKKFKKDSNLTIQFNLSYNLEDEELSALKKLGSKFDSFNNHNISRGVVIENLGTVVNDLFKKHIQVPPKISNNRVEINEIVCNHDSIYIAGRYCKYSRSLGQTPWVIDNVKKFETSVQDIIFEPLYDLFKCKSLVFSASGREDFDVRTLGRGRPFFIKINDPKRTNITFEEFRKIENTVSKSSVVAVKYLQFIEKKDLEQVKNGEEFKRKKYRALCIIYEPERMDEFIEKINKLTTISLEQRTPIRVYHRRSKGDRKKEIYQIEARRTPGKDNLFELDVEAQAGTYVKEFVHGDFGRTKPSLGKLIGGKVDIVALDVLDVLLDFPPPIDT